jgi:hypothetical protein
MSMYKQHLKVNRLIIILCSTTLLAQIPPTDKIHTQQATFEMKAAQNLLQRSKHPPEHKAERMWDFLLQAHHLTSAGILSCKYWRRVFVPFSKMGRRIL